MITETSRTGLHLDDDNPWPGLAAYDEASTRFFFGREHDTIELLRLVRLSPLVALYGKSGLGKSSMLQAGVFPQLRKEHFLPVYLRLDFSEGSRQSPMEQAAARLREEIDAWGHDAPLPEAGEDLWAYLQRRERPIWSPDNFPLTPVLVLDQFEEVFSRGGSAEHVKSMLDSIADLVADRLPPNLAEDREAARRLNLQTQQYHVVLSFRSDFLAEVESWEKRAFLPRRESLHLTAMSRERAIEAVDRAGAAVLTPGMGAQIVDFLLEREDRVSPGRVTDVEPVLLSLCCYQLNKRRQPGAKIDAALLDTVGEGILKGFYEEALKGEANRVRKFIEDNLIQGDRYRSSYPRDGALESGDLTQEELARLERRRLLRIDPQGGEPRIELIHDRLVSVVREARDQRRSKERQRREQEEAEKQARAAQAASQLAESQSDRRRLLRQRLALGAMLVLMTGALGAAGAFWKEAMTANEQVTRESDALKETSLALNANLYSTQAELEKAKRALYELEAKHAGEAGDVAGQQKEDSAKRMLAEIRKQDLQTSRAKAAGRLDMSQWRLSSGGCGKGQVSVSGSATFKVEAIGSEVEVREDFPGRGAGFIVDLSTTDTFPRTTAGYYDLATTARWTQNGVVRFSTTGVDRVYVDKDGKPTRASLLKIRTTCPG